METVKDCCMASHPLDSGRRNWLKAGVGAGSAALMATAVSLAPRGAEAASLTQAQRDAMTPDQVIEMMKQGNERFRAGKPQEHDYLAQKRSSASGQFPAAVILSCIDSRTPVEIILDAGIGDTFNGRVAGNISNDDLLGSMEFACAAMGSKLVLVMGHSACGAIVGAIDNVELGHLTGLLKIIKPAVEATKYSGDRSGSNPEFVDAVAITNVHHTVGAIRKNSSILAGLEKEGKIKIVGSMYDLGNGMVTFLN